ncbi:hypothetical protein EZV62_023340 [Acer yangbiense]|uniref:RRM domain-containing protein n=1 Tax=Acer yangbiense TaxID=1000413 RepID=A0A5C7H3H3_9ROSI|nr:hypothetical protein EZV62_023340 [Acer yangbiense]
MSAATIPIFKTLSMAESTSLLSLPSLFTTTRKPPHPCLSIPPKTAKLHLSSLNTLSLKLNRPIHSSPFTTFVAQTSDWPNQEEDSNTTITLDQQQKGEESTWENEESDGTGANLSDWEPEGQDTPIVASDNQGEAAESEEESFVEPPEEAKLFVGNLPYDIDSQKLAMLFEKAGIVEISEVIYNRETERSRGFGFVTMSTVEEAEKAVEMFNRYIHLDQFLKNPRLLESCCYLSCSNMPLSFYPSSFARTGMAVKLIDDNLMNLRGHRTLCSCRQKFKNQLGYDIDGRLLTVNKAAPRGSEPERPPRAYEPAFRIYVGNLPWEVDNARLEQVFSEHGKVINARVVYDRESGRSRGFGFVTMATETELNDAIAALDGQNLDGRAIRVNVAEERARRF